MSDKAGIWIDHRKAVTVAVSEDEVTATTLESDVEPHPHWAGSQEGGGEKNYEERHSLHLDRFYDDVINQIGQPRELLIFGPGEAKQELKARLGRSEMFSNSVVVLESADRMTDPEIVGRVKEHYGLAR